MIFSTVYDAKYPLIALSLVIFISCYLYNNDVELPDRKYMLLGGILLVPVWVHFVLLWSNLVIIRIIGSVIHISPYVIVGFIGLVLYVLSLNGTGLIISELYNIIRKIRVPKIKISRFVLLMNLLFVIASVAVIYLKDNYHLDEMMSYGLANHKDGIYMSFEEGITYSDSEDVFLEYLSADKDYTFDYSIPYANQESDVHPPVYYFILHTISSFFPGTFSKWYAGAINILFGLLALNILAKEILLYSNGDRRALYLILPAFILSVGILNATAFFRMYSVTMFLGLLLSYELSKSVDRKSSTYLFYSGLSIIIMISALTHYYLIIFSAFICLLYGILLVLQKRWKDILGLVLSSGIAAAYAIMLFPEMLFHMFSGYRGEEAIDNLSKVNEGYIGRLSGFYNLINRELTGHLLLLVLIAVFLVIIFLRYKKFVMVTGAVILYVLMICKISGGVEKRYFYPIYGIMLFLAMFSIYAISDIINKKYGFYISIVFISCITILGYIGYDWEYLYKQDENLLNFAEEHTDVDCLYIYGLRWMIQPSYMEARNYNSITLVRHDDLYMLENLDITDDYELIIILADTQMSDIEDQLREAFPNLGDYQEIGTHSLSTTYYFK